MKKSQMLVQPEKVVAGASSTLAKRWQGISWDDVKANVRRLQMMKWSAPTLQAPKGGTLNTASKEPKW